MHMLLWIRNVMTPQEIRDKIMDPESDFQKAMVEYLESVHMGEFINGTMETVGEHLEEQKKKNPFKVPPTETLPQVPPPRCDHSKKPNCESCNKHQQWWTQYKEEVDKILYLSNVHHCVTKNKSTQAPKGAKNSGLTEVDNRGCTNPDTGECKARFPRLLSLKQLWTQNTFTPVVSYLMCCNHDVTSLLSGTAIKSVVGYVADYITKTPLKTHVMFQSVRQVFERNVEFQSPKKRKPVA